MVEGPSRKVGRCQPHSSATGRAQEAPGPVLMPPSPSDAGERGLACTAVLRCLLCAPGGCTGRPLVSGTLDVSPGPPSARGGGGRTGGPGGPAVGDVLWGVCSRRLLRVPRTTAPSSWSRQSSYCREPPHGWPPVTPQVQAGGVPLPGGLVLHKVVAPGSDAPRPGRSWSPARWHRSCAAPRSYCFVLHQDERDRHVLVN